MKQWFAINAVSDRVHGWHRSGKATELPADTTERRFVECTDTEIGEYGDLQREAADDGRNSTVLYPEGDVLQLPADTRPYLRIEASKLELDADGVDSVTVTFSRLTPGTTNIMTGFNATINMPLGDRLLKLTFSSGVAVKTYKTTKSGIFEFKSVIEYKLEDPLTITATE